MGSLAFRLAIVIGTVTTGCMNSVFTKYQDNQCVKNCSNPDVSTHKNFEQPAIQTLQMFIGELSVFVVYYFVYVSKFSHKRQGYQQIADEDQPDANENVSLLESIKLSIPSICDLCATTLLNIGLVYTPVSIYQMTRGAIVLFVAILSVLFLKRKITTLEWISLIIVSLGVAIVGYSGSRTAPSGETSAQADEASALVVLGISLIIVAVSLQALQFVFEEHILAQKSIVPLKLVYIEGFYGFTILTVVLVVLNFIIGAISKPSEFVDSPFNLHESLLQMFSSREVLISSVLIMISIASFNFCGISLTHEFSATSRSTIDTCRTLLVWLVAIFAGWESFHLLQFVGFATLVFGTLCFNGVLKPEEWSWIPASWKDSSNERLIDVVDEQIERL